MIRRKTHLALMVSFAPTFSILVPPVEVATQPLQRRPLELGDSFSAMTCALGKDSARQGGRCRVHLRSPLDVEALRLPVELFLGSLLTHRHCTPPLDQSLFLYPDKSDINAGVSRAEFSLTASDRFLFVSGDLSRKELWAPPLTTRRVRVRAQRQSPAVAA
jgi:hypothetical protein